MEELQEIDKVEKLYNTLSSDNRYSGTIGTLDEFKTKIANPEKAKKLHSVLSSDSRYADVIGDETTFLQKVSASPKQPAPSNSGGVSGAVSSPSQVPPLVAPLPSENTQSASVGLGGGVPKPSKSQTKGRETTFAVSQQQFKKLQDRGEDVFEQDGKFYHRKSQIGPEAKGGIPTTPEMQAQMKPAKEQPEFAKIFEQSKIGIVNPDIQDFNKPQVEQDFAQPQPPIEDLVDRTKVVRELKKGVEDELMQLQTGLEQLKNQADRLYADFEANPTPEAEQKVTEVINNYNETLKFYNRKQYQQAAYERRILETSDSIKQLANDLVPDGFWSALVKGVRGNLKSWEEAYDLANLSKEEQIQFAYDMEAMTPTKESGKLEEYTEMAGGVIPDIATAIGLSLIGAPYAGAAAVATRQGAQQAAEDFSRAFIKAKREGVTGADGVRYVPSDDEAYEIATRAAGIGALTGAAEGLVGTIGGGKLVTKAAEKIAEKVATTTAKRETARVVAGKALDTASDAVIAGGMQTGRNVYDQYQGLDTKTFENVPENMIGEAMLGAPINTFTGVRELSANRRKRMAKDVVQQIEQHKTNAYELSKIWDNLKILKNQGIISQADHDMLVNRATGYIKAIESVPDWVKNKSKAAELIAERNELVESKANIDPAFHGAVDDQIAFFNAQIADVDKEQKDGTPDLQERVGESEDVGGVGEKAETAQQQAEDGQAEKAEPPTSEDAVADESGVTAAPVSPALRDVESTAKALEDKKSSLDEKAKKLGYIGIKQFNAQNQLNENLTDAEKELLQEYSDFQQEIKNLKDENVIAKLSDDEFSSWSKANDITRDDLGKVVKDEEIELAAKRIRILNARGDSKKAESELKKLKESKKKDNWTIESWKERFDEDIEQSEIDDINSSNKEFNKSVDKAVESLLSKEQTQPIKDKEVGSGVGGVKEIKKDWTESDFNALSKEDGINRIGSDLYIKPEADINGLIEKYGIFVVRVKDANGYSAELPANEYAVMIKNKTFSDRVKQVSFAYEGRNQGIPDGFMSDIRNGKELVLTDGNISDNLKLPANTELISKSTVNPKKAKEIIDAINNEDVQDLLQNLGIKRVVIEKPGALGLSEQGNYHNKSKTLTLSADLENPLQTILHEIGHERFENLPEKSKEELRKLANKDERTTYENDIDEFIVDNFYQGYDYSKSLKETKGDLPIRIKQPNSESLLSKEQAPAKAVAQPAKPSSSEIPNRSEEQDETTALQRAKLEKKNDESLFGGEAEKRRKIGKFVKDGIEYVRQKLTNGSYGKEGEVRFAKDVTRPFKFKLIEAEELQPSHQGGIRNPLHFIPEAQPKTRSDKGSIAAELEFARRPRFNEMGADTDAYGGAPIVNQRGEVIQGNNRSAGLRIGYGENVKIYKEALAKQAEDFGFTPEQVQGMKNPVLVREIDTTDADAIELGNYDVKDLETGGSEGINPVRVSARMPKSRKAALLEFLKDENTIKEAIRNNFKDVVRLVSPYLNTAQRTSLMKPDGTPSEKGMDGLEAVIQQFLFDEGDVALADIFSTLPSNKQKGILGALGKLLSVDSDSSILPELQASILAVADFYASGFQNFGEWKNKIDMFTGQTPSDTYSETELAIAEKIATANNINDIKLPLMKYAELVNGQPQTMLEEEIKPISKEEAIQQIFNPKKNEKQTDGKAAKSTKRSQDAKGSEQQAQALNNPKSAKDVAVIFRSLGFDPTRAVMAARLFDAKATFMAKMRGISKEDYYKQYWITDKMDGGVAASRKGAWSKEAAKYKRLIAMYENADDSTTAHEILGHDFFDEIIELAKTNPEFEADLNTIVEEYIKETKSKKSKAEILAAVKAFDVENMKKGDIAIEVHEWFSKAAERYFETEKGVKETSPKLKRLFELFRQRIAEIYNRLSRPLQAISEPMQEIFRKAFGKENFDAIMRMKENVDEGMIVDKLLDNTPPDSAYDDVFDALFQVEAWHGSPYQFDKFTTDKIGTGEGAQAFGWGLYFTDLESIARNYAEKLAPTPLKVNKKNIDDYLYSEDVDADNIDYTIIYDAKTKDEALNIIDKEIKTKEKLIEEIDEFINDEDNSRVSVANAVSRKFDVEKRVQDLYDFYNAIFRAKDYELNEKNRNLYKVSLHKGKTPDQYTWLEWDKPVSRGTSEKIVVQFIEEGLVSELDKEYSIQEYILKSGRALYGKLSQELGSDKEASLFLLRAGIDGIKYPAESIARGATSDTARGFNYVVFDENAVEIEEKMLFQEAPKPTISPKQYVIEATKRAMAKGIVDYSNVIPFLEEMTNKGIGKGILTNRHFEAIAMYEDLIRNMFVAEGKKESLTARSLTNSPLVAEDVKKQMAADGIFEYTLETIAQWAKDAETLINSIGTIETYNMLVNKTLPTDKVPTALALTIGRLNNLINAAQTAKERDDLVQKQNVLAGLYVGEGTAAARALNEFKILSRLHPITLAYRYKEKYKQSRDNNRRRINSAYDKMKLALDNAHKNLDYFVELNVNYEEELAKRAEEIRDLEAKLEKEKGKEYTPNRGQKTGKKLQVAGTKEFAERLAKFKAAQAAKGLGQSDLEQLSDEQYFAYGIMEAESMSFDKFVKQYNKIVGGKYELTDTEIQDLYTHARQTLFENGMHDVAEFSTDAEIFEAAEKYKTAVQKRKERLTKARVRKDMAEELAKKRAITDAKTIKKIEAAIKEKEAQILKETLDSVAQPGLWDRYVQAAMGRIIGNMASKLPSTPKEKALLDEFTALVTKEINQLVNESTDAYKPIKTTPDYASQLADLINNKEKFEQVFEEAKRQFAEKNPNANTVLQKLDNATNPFSGKLLEKALEQEAKNYTMAVKDLAYKYAGMRDSMRDQIINEIVSKTGLQGNAATELKDSLRTKFDGLIDDVKVDVASTLANFVIADAKKATSTTPKQKEYLNELLGYLRSKARDNYKAKLQKELKDPYEELRYAIEMLNDQNGREIWDNSKAQVLANIEADQTLSQSEKDALFAYLNDYQNAIFDQLLSKNKLYEIIRKALMENPDFNDKSGNVNWKGIITNANGDITAAKKTVLKAVQNATAGYLDSEIQAVLDAVMDRFGAAIQDKKREIAQRQLEDLVKNTFKTKLGIRNKTKVRGLVEKALEFHGSGLMEKTNRAGERVADTLIAEAMGLEEMTEEDWVEFDRLANNIKDTPQGNERNRAIEELASFIALKMPGSGIRKMTAKSYNFMLGRPSTIGKNSTGLLEQFTIAFSDIIRGDMQAAKIALRGMREGDSTDVLEGGVNQGSRLDVEVNNQTGLPHVNIAKYLYNTAPSKLQKFFWSDYKLPAVLDAVDAKAQKMSQNRADYLGTIDYLMNKNPGMKRKEAAKIAYENLMSGQLFEEAKREAAAEFRRRGINPTDARLKRRAYEIIRNRSVDESVRELSDIISLEDTYKTPLPAKNTQSRLQKNIGIGTAIGKALAFFSEGAQSTMTFALQEAFKMDEMKAQAISEQIVKVSLLPFARGVANVAEHSLEKTPYGMVKAGIGYAYAKAAKKPVTMAEKLEQQALERMFKDKFIKSAITSTIIMAVVYGAMEALEDDWEKEDEEYKKKHRRPGIKLRTDKDTKFIDPVGVMTIPFGDKDIDIPLSMFGTMGMGTAFWKAADNAIRNRTIKKVKDPEAFLNPDAANLMLDIGDIAVGMNAYQGINDLIGYFDQDRRGRKDFAPEDYAINRAPIFVPYAGLIQQTLDSYKVLSSDNNRAQVAITPSEKAFKAFGLAGIAYDRPAIDYRGRELEMRQRNIEGIAGIAGVLKPIDFKFDEIDRYLQDIDYNPTFTKRLDEDFVNDEGYGLTKEQYYDYKKKAGQMFNELLLEFYPDIEKYTFEPTEAEIESMLAEYERKAGVSQNSALFYKNDAIVNEVETDYINKKKREMVAMLQNLAEKTAAVELGLLSDKKSKEEAKKVTDKIEDFRTKMKPRLNKR